MTSPTRHPHGHGALPSPDSVKILVTVGNELPFDRLVMTVDRWAQQCNRSIDVLAQIGGSEHPPPNLPWARFIDGPDFIAYFKAADLIVSHAGMGTILTALFHQRPLLVMPRRASLGEHRNEHQLATAERLFAQGKIDVALDEAELIARLDDPDIRAKEPIGPDADAALIDAISAAILGSASTTRAAVANVDLAPLSDRRFLGFSRGGSGALVAKPGVEVLGSDRTSSR